MPNFPPLRRYVFSVVDRWIRRHRLSGPFLEVGCGTGALARHLAGKGWSGTAIDSSPLAAAAARAMLAGFGAVEVGDNGLAGLGERKFSTIFIMDVLEHVRDDAGLLGDLAGRLDPGGAMVLLAPVNPSEWRQDDVLYGHFRRYGWDELEGKLGGAGLAVTARWNVTVPFMWTLRRIYLKLLPPRTGGAPRDTLTAASSFYNPWSEHPLLRIVGVAFGLSWWWWLPFRIQDLFSCSRGGHAAMFLARRKSS